MSLSTSLKHQETAADVPDVPVASGSSWLHVRTTDCAPDAINAAADGDSWVERGVEGLRVICRQQPPREIRNKEKKETGRKIGKIKTIKKYRKPNCNKNNNKNNFYKNVETKKLHEIK